MNLTTSQKAPVVSAIFDYIIEVSGVFPYQQRQFFCVKNRPELNMIVISANTNSAFLLLNFTDLNQIQIGDELEVQNHELSVVTPHYLFGHIINIESQIIFPKKKQPVSDLSQLPRRKIFGNAHNLKTVRTLNQQLYTGIIAIDLLIPIGKGQRQLIIGDRQTGKTHIALNTIINQANSGVKCIYVAIGQRREQLAQIYQILQQNNALSNTMVIDAPSTSAYAQYLAPYVAMAHAENIALNHDVLVVFDDLTKHANILREIALLTDKPVGKEAMPGDLFFAHSSLLERAGAFSDKKTITALPIIKTIDGDITSLIASNVISITDGQIVTNTDLFLSGKLPALDLDLSVSRTGSSVQSRTITKIAGQVGKVYRAYKRHLKLAQLDYEFNEAMSDLLSKGKMIEQMFQQKGFSLYSQQFLLLMSKLILWGLLRNIPQPQKALEFLDVLIQHHEDAKRIFNKISTNQGYDDHVARDFFAYSLDLYSKAANFGWTLSYQHQFVNLTQAQLQEYVQLINKSNSQN